MDPILNQLTPCDPSEYFDFLSSLVFTTDPSKLIFFIGFLTLTFQPHGYAILTEPLAERMESSLAK
jgi:hypothetical protein